MALHPAVPPTALAAPHGRRPAAPDAPGGKAPAVPDAPGEKAPAVPDAPGGNGPAVPDAPVVGPPAAPRAPIRDRELGSDSPREPRWMPGEDPAPGSGLARLRHNSGLARRTVLTASGVRGTAIEVAWLSTHVAMYPLGLAGERFRESRLHHTMDGMPLKHRGLLIHDVEAAGTPIVLVHGVVDNRSVFALLKRGLRRRGFGRILTVNYSPLSDDIRAVAKRLADVIEAVVHETGYERVHVVGHSMGGLIGRYYVQRMGGHARVHTLVTLGSPHGGTLPATWVPHPIAKQMRPDSDIVAEFEQPALHCNTRILSVWSDLDLMIVPKVSARVVHPDLRATNVFVRGVGHMSLPVDGRVVHEICTTLAHLDAEGHTLDRTASAAPGQRLA